MVGCVSSMVSWELEGERGEMGLLPQGFTLAIDVLGVTVGCP